jgi:hypothetical protein
MVTQLVAGGVDWRTVSGRAGHADGHMTLDTYAHFQQAQDRQAAEFMESLLAPAATPDARCRPLRRPAAMTVRLRAARHPLRERRGEQVGKGAYQRPSPLLMSTASCVLLG